MSHQVQRVRVYRKELLNSPINGRYGSVVKPVRDSALWVVMLDGELRSHCVDRDSLVFLDANDKPLDGQAEQGSS